MKNSTYLYYTPPPSPYGRGRASRNQWLKDTLKIVILFVLGIIIAT